jgi:predicted Zn-dependent peptidase
VNQFTLSNGLKVIHKEITNNPLVTVQLFTRAGALNEDRSQAGLAQFTQSLLVQGTATRNAEQLATDIEDTGGNLSSDIEHDYGSIGISLLDSNFSAAMEMVADMALHPSFPEGEIEKERSNILAALKSRQDQIFYVANDLLNVALYGDHPYSWPETGKADTVAHFTRQDLVAWHAKYYVTDQMLLVVAGNVSLATVKAAADKYFGTMARGTGILPPPAATIPAAQKLSQATKKFKQAYVMVGYPAPALTSTDFPVLKVVNALLGGRMTGRLFTELREKQSLGYEVNSFYPSRKELSRFVIYLGLEKKNLARAKDGIAAIIKDLKEKPVEAKELQETKNYISGIYLLDHQTIGRQAWNMGFWETAGRGYAYDDQYINDLMAVTSSDIQKAARQYFTDNSVQVEIVPE